METNCSKTVQSTNCKGTNVYVNCCCPGDGGEAGAFKGTNVYVDARNGNADPDGTINNPFKRVQDAFDYVDSNDENYIINVINVSSDDTIWNYTFKSKGHIGILGSWADLNTYGSGIQFISLRTIETESRILLRHLAVDTLDIYDAAAVELDSMRVGYTNFYGIAQNITLNNIVNNYSVSNIAIKTEGEMALLPGFHVMNSSIRLVLNNPVYYGYAYNSYIESITTDLAEGVSINPLIQMHVFGCKIGTIDNQRGLNNAYFNLSQTTVNEITQNVEEGFSYIVVRDNDLYLNDSFIPVNYTAEKNTLLANLEAIDKKLGELEARLGA